VLWILVLNLVIISFMVGLVMGLSIGSDRR